MIQTILMILSVQKTIQKILIFLLPVGHKKKNSCFRKKLKDYIDQKVVLKKGDFIVVKYETNKRNIMHIEQVENKNPPLVYINFLR